MSCEKTREKFADFLAGEIEDESRALIQAHLSACPACREEMESLSTIWTKLGVLPKEQPGPALRQRFYEMLEAYKDGLDEARTGPGLRRTISGWFERVMPRQPVYQFALSLILLAAGLGAGYLLNGSRPAAKNEIAALHSEVTDMRRTVAISMLKQASPSERLMGVSWSSRLESPDEETLQALLEVLDHDPNVSVRLAAVDALYLFYDNPRVKAGLIESLAGQTSPLVQISLINLLVEIRERRAVKALEQLIQNKRLNPRVRERAEMVLAKLT
jgi:anti-sigma factor RsiW